MYTFYLHDCTYLIILANGYFTHLCVQNPSYLEEITITTKSDLPQFSACFLSNTNGQNGLNVYQ